MICIRARGRGAVVEKARIVEAARGSVRRKDCIAIVLIFGVTV